MDFSFFTLGTQALPDGIWLILAAIFGAVLGSFFGMAVYRVPKMMYQKWHDEIYTYLKQSNAATQTTNADLATLLNTLQTNADEKLSLCLPASHCPSCRVPIRFYDNIPIISQLWLRGRCRHCHTAIAPMYLALEIITACLTVLVLVVQGVNLTALLSLIFVYFAIVLSAIDYQEQLLPDRLVLPLGLIGMLANGFGIFAPANHAIFGAAAGFVLFWAIGLAYRLLRGHDGMGLGDAKFFAACGAWLGIVQLPLVLLVAASLGVVIGVIYRWRTGISQPFAFGPCLAVGAVVALLFGDQILAWYLSLAQL